MSKSIVVIGGDAAGMSAASKIKRELKGAEVIVLERGEHISFSACGMPYWLGGVIESDDELLVLTPDVARKKRGIDVRMHHEATAIDPGSKRVAVTNLDSGESFELAYDKLVIATGASAMRPPIPGLDLPGVFTLRSLSDSQRIFAFMAEKQPTTAVVIGGGYIGIEMAEALRERKIDVHVVEMLPQIMPNFDEDMVGEITEHIRKKGVHLHLNTRVNAIDGQGDRLQVQTSDALLAADMVLVSTGVRPNAELARDAALKLGNSGAIWVDDHMCTSDADIYAAGDCVEYRHLVLDENVWIPLAPSANKSGRIAGDNISGGDVAFPGILGTAVVKVFDYTVSTTGLTESQAKASGKFGRDGEGVGATVISAHDRAHYWPGAAKIKTKLVFNKRDGKVLGGQLVGMAGVNKRIDIVATAITAGMTVADMSMLDLSYAPPYSPVYDPVQVAANVAMKQVG